MDYFAHAPDTRHPRTACGHSPGRSPACTAARGRATARRCCVRSRCRSNASFPSSQPAAWYWCHSQGAAPARAYGRAGATMVVAMDTRIYYIGDYPTWSDAARSVADMWSRGLDEYMYSGRWFWPTTAGSDPRRDPHEVGHRGGT